MNQSYRLSINILLILAFTCPKVMACGFDFVGSCATTARLSANGVATDYFVSNCPYSNQLIGANLGTNLTTLQLTSATTITWESCTNMLKATAVYYRVYKDPLSKGTFTKVGLVQQSLFNNPPYRTYTFGNTFTIDLLAGLQANTGYTLELYYEMSVDTDGNGSIDATKLSDNGGIYYAASFRTGNINVNSGFPVSVTPQNVACFGGNNGSATATASGGTAPYTFAWSNSATGVSVANLTAGNYSVTVTDATNATGIKSFTITQPNAFTVGLATTNASCLQTNGSITATANGGTPPYTYAWSNSNTTTTATINNLAAGNFSLTVTDSKGCTATGSALIIENCGSVGNYCTSASAAPWNEWISRVQFGTIDNTSDKIRADKYAVGYSDWKDKATSLTQGTSYPLSITPSLSWSGAQTSLYYRAWIDFNKNGTFETSEQVFEKTALSLGVSGTVNIPSTASLGSTVMRISMKKDAYPTACEAFAAGEVEDYTVVIAASTGDPCLNDAIAPVFQNCPNNISLTTNTTTAVATWTAPTATDNCTTTPTITSTQNSGFTFPIGTTNVVYTATDTKNNTSTCSFIVTVTSANACTNDVTPPVFSNCPQNITLQTATTTAIATWTPPTATDNCTATPIVTSTFASGAVFPIGTTAVVYTAKDAKNNTATCSFSVTVQTQTTSNADIALTIAANPSVFKPFTTLTVTITAKNVGKTDFTNVQIEFKFPTGTASGGTAVPSVGTWNEYCAGGIQCFTWTIPSFLMFQYETDCLTICRV